VRDALLSTLITALDSQASTWVPGGYHLAGDLAWAVQNAGWSIRRPEIWTRCKRSYPLLVLDPSTLPMTRLRTSE
jgi:hypothetical protein